MPNAIINEIIKQSSDLLRDYRRTQTINEAKFQVVLCSSLQTFLLTQNRKILQQYLGNTKLKKILVFISFSAFSILYSDFCLV